MKLKRKQVGSNGRHFTTRVRAGIWLALVVVALGGLLAFAAQGQVRAPGILVAESALQDVGEVSMQGSLIEARFPLDVEGDARVIAITTS